MTKDPGRGNSCAAAAGALPDRRGFPFPANLAPDAPGRQNMQIAPDLVQRIGNRDGLGVAISDDPESRPTMKAGANRCRAPHKRLMMALRSPLPKSTERSNRSRRSARMTGQDCLNLALPRARGKAHTRSSQGRCWNRGATSSATSTCSAASGNCSLMARKAGVIIAASPKYRNCMARIFMRRRLIWMVVPGPICSGVSADTRFFCGGQDKIAGIFVVAQGPVQFKY